MDAEEAEIRIAVLRRLLSLAYQSGLQLTSRVRILETENAQLRAQLLTQAIRQPPTYDEVRFFR